MLGMTIIMVVNIVGATNHKEMKIMNRDELKAMKHDLMKHYERMLINDTDGTLGAYSFVDHLIMTIDFLQHEINDLRWGNNK